MRYTAYMTACEVYEQQNGEVTKAYYEKMNSKGLLGNLAVALFRAHKRSTAAKSYRGGRFRREAYDVKNWSLSEVVRILTVMPDGMFPWGWKKDEKTPGFEWVLYVVLPSGQCSFHSADRLGGPDFAGDWDGLRASKERILAYCDSVVVMTDEELGACKQFLRSAASEPVAVSPWDRMRQQLQGR